MAQDVFIQLSLIITIAVAISFLMRLLRQPLIMGYIITGVLVSPLFLDLIPSTSFLSAFSQLGIVFLLFIVGLNLNPNIVRRMGGISLITGIGQILLTGIVGYLIAQLFGFSATLSLYLGIAISFSSTIIAVKLITDRNDIETLHGRLSVGVLLVQDLVAIITLIIISASAKDVSVSRLIIETLLKGIGLLCILFVISNWVLPRLAFFVARSQEFLFLFGLGWLFALGATFELSGFSLEIGALVAGITLSMTQFHHAISSKVRPLRDFFLITFFIMLGSKMEFFTLSKIILPAIVFSVFVLFGKPIITMAIMGIAGYTKKNSFLTGITLAQVSEFSIILFLLGLSLGQLTNADVSLITMVSIITIAGSSYMLIYANSIYRRISPSLGIFERGGAKKDTHTYQKRERYDIILFGYNRIGYSIVETLKKKRKKFLIIDYNPETIVNLANEGFECRYGDAHDLELINDINIKSAKMVISTIPDVDVNMFLVKQVHDINPKAIVIAMASQVDDALDMYEEGASYVLMPHLLGGHHASMMIEEYGFDMKKFLRQKVAHMEHIHARKGHFSYTIHENHPHKANSHREMHHAVH